MAESTRAWVDERGILNVQLMETIARLIQSLAESENAAVEWTIDQVNNIAYANEHALTVDEELELWTGRQSL